MNLKKLWKKKVKNSGVNYLEKLYNQKDEVKLQKKKMKKLEQIENKVLDKFKNTQTIEQQAMNTL